MDTAAVNQLFTCSGDFSFFYSESKKYFCKNELWFTMRSWLLNVLILKSFYKMICLMKTCQTLNVSSQSEISNVVSFTEAAKWRYFCFQWRLSPVKFPLFYVLQLFFCYSDELFITTVKSPISAHLFEFVILTRVLLLFRARLPYNISP